VEIRPVRPEQHPAAARLITDALLDDPGWRSVGPNRRAHRRLVAGNFHRVALGVVARHGGLTYGAAADGELRGVAVTFPTGVYPPPPLTILRYVPGFLLAGPGPIVRGLRVSAIEDRGHPREPHVFLWFFAVAPPHQRAGVGRALLRRVIEDAEAPVYLDTSNPANLPYYAGFGFEEIGRAALPRGATMWFMKRP
jgi:GNAT superfamily N-acetyltransferase